MYQSITIDNLDVKFIQQLNKRLELFLDHITSIKHNSVLTNYQLIQIRINLHHRYELRNNYYNRKYPLVLHDLSIIKSTKKHFQLIEKQHYHSIQFYKKTFNIQSSSSIEQSCQHLDELKTTVNQYENDIHQLKQQIISQNNQINFYSNNLFQIQFEQNLIQSDIQQLKQKIRLQKQLITEQNSISNPEDLRQNLLTQISQIKFNIEQKSNDVLLLLFELHVYHTNKTTFPKLKNQSFLVPTTVTKEINYQSASLINKFNENIVQSEQLPTKSTSKSEWTKSQSIKKSLGPNIQSRLEALEAAMGVRLNLAKSQGRHSLSNTTSPSPMQLSPTSTTISNSLSSSSRHNIPARTGQGIHRSASSCDVENRPGPIKRLKPSLPNDNPTSSSTVSAIATIKKYPPTVRPSIITTDLTPTKSKESTPIKQRSSPMDTLSPRLSRSSTTSHNTSSNSSNYRTPIGGISPKNVNSPSPKQTKIDSSPRPPISISRKQRLSMFGEQFSTDILKRNLLWIDLNELDDENRSEVILQFGSIEHFLREQSIFFSKQQQQLKLAAKHKTIVSRTRFQLFTPKKDRLELL